MNAGHQAIKCGVKNCRHNDQSRYCMLSDITVGQDNINQAKSKRETECTSFESI